MITQMTCFYLGGLKSNLCELKIEQNLSKLEGILRVSIFNSKIRVEYDPLLVEKKTIENLIITMGYTIQKKYPSNHKWLNTNNLDAVDLLNSILNSQDNKK